VDSKIAFERYFAENFPEKLEAMKAAQEERRKAKEERRSMKQTGVSAQVLSRMPDSPEAPARPRRRRRSRGGRSRRPTSGEPRLAPEAA
jgi:hypothetical protein